MHHEHTFIWEYDPITKKSICTFELAGSNKNYDKSHLLSSLENIPGISITEIEEAVLYTSISSKDEKTNNSFPDIKKIKNTHAVIEDTETFTQQHKMRIIYDSLRTKKNNSGFFSLPIDSISDIKPETLSIQSFITKEFCPDVWGNTLSYIDYFGNKTASDANTRQNNLIFSESDLIKKFQYLHNNILYPIKELQMKIMCSIFDEILAPTYKKLKGNTPLSPTLKKHFGIMVENVMLNQCFNQGPTSFEKLSAEDQKEKFKSHGKLMFAIKQERMARVNIMLMDFLYFISPDISAQDLIVDKDGIELLTCLRASLDALQKECFSEKLHTLRELTIHSGQTQDTIDRNNIELNHQIQKKTEQIGKLYSCYQIIYQVFQKVTDKDCKELTEDTVSNIVEKLGKNYNFDLGSKGYISALYSSHKDFYLTKELADALKIHLKEKITSKIKPKNLPNETTTIMMDFIHKYLLEHIQNNQTHEDSNNNKNFETYSTLQS